MDEPASALDPISTEKVEATMRKLRRNYTIIIVTHNMQQASRVSDFTTFFHQGRVVEFAPTQELFQTPRVKMTEDYISGNFG
jgi:phosphate transport system ATP-binding protein